MNYHNPNYYMNNNYPYPMQNTTIGLGNTVLNGKIVDSAEMARIAEVPLGSYGIFPKADFSEIYIKSWNNNGTTSLMTFQPTKTMEKEQDFNKTIIEKIELLESKIDSLIPKAVNTEVLTNDF